VSVGTLFKSVLRSGPVTTVGRRITRGRLRILGYHGVSDPGCFNEQMEYVAANFTPVSEGAIVDALGGTKDLPDGAVWVTFDDGDPTVVCHALPILERLRIPATMFVCPGLIEQHEPFWWRATEWATEYRPELAREVAGPHDLTEYVKTIEDSERRRVVTDVLAQIDRPYQSDWQQLSRAELSQWTGAGMDLGNHSWDHPCLDRCSPADQESQIQRTHEWLRELLGHPPRTFAYPNGNFSPVVDALACELGYDVGLLYDHRLTDLTAARLQLSRLRVEAHHSVGRLRGTMSGAQPLVRSVADKLIAKGPSSQSTDPSN